MLHVSRARTPIQPGPIAAILGDSITANNSANTAHLLTLQNHGYFTWANTLSGKRLNFPLANNFGVSGDRLDQILARVPNVMASGAEICFVLGGTNDLVQGTAFATMQANMLSILSQLLAAGVQPIVIPILPRDVGSGGFTSAMLRVQGRFNNWLRELGYGRSDVLLAAGLPTHKYPIIVDPTQYIQNAADANGNTLANMLIDGLHPATTGAYWVGKAISDVLKVIIPPRPTILTAVGDIYDATNNPAGNLLFTSSANDGLLAGTGGTMTAGTNLTISGSVATDWNARRSSGGSGVATMTLSKENPRTDGPNSGERQRVQVSTTSGGSTQESFALFYSRAIDASFAIGDTVYAEAAYSLNADPTGTLKAISVFLLEAGPASATTAADGYRDGAHDGPVPKAHSGVLRTPPFTIQASTTALNVFLRVEADASAAGGFDIYWSDVSLRKLL